jgi:hypothetical protein
VGGPKVVQTRRGIDQVLYTQGLSKAEADLRTILA